MNGQIIAFAGYYNRSIIDDYMCFCYVALALLAAVAAASSYTTRKKKWKQILNYVGIPTIVFFGLAVSNKNNNILVMTNKSSEMSNKFLKIINLINT